jgi:cell shape-determining protein MreD
MSFLKILVAILIIAVLQVNILPVFWFLKIRPDLLLIAAIALSLNIRSLPKLTTCALLCGLLKDVFNMRLFGFNMFMFFFYASCVYFILRYLYRGAGWLKFVFLFSATFLHYIIISLIFRKPYIMIGIIEAAMNCLLMPLAAKCLQPIMGGWHVKT